MTDRRLEWLAALAKLTTPLDPERAAQAMMAYAPMLQSIPVEAFCMASLEHVALSERRMMIPDLSEVVNPLRAWWRDNKPVRQALPAPVVLIRPEPSDAEKAAVKRTMDRVRRGLTSREPVEPQRTVDEQLRVLRNAT